MRLVSVDTPALANAWVRMPVRLYADDPNYIQPLDQDVEAIFDPVKNKKFRRGKAVRWLLQDESGEYLGRIAAFYEEPALKKKPVGAGGIGFFDCVDDDAAARTLFEAAEGWLRAAGANAVDGPINFGDRDRFWGCLAEGFLPPNYCCTYNAPYYVRFFEQNGYQTYFRQLTYQRPVRQPMHPSIAEKAERIALDPAYRFRHIAQNEIDSFAENFRTVYNKAWGKHDGVAAMSEAHAKAVVKQLKPVIDPRLIWFGFHDDEPISFFIMLPELNQVFRHLHGRFGWWEKLKFLFYMKTQRITKAFGLVYGVVPEYQGKGIESAMTHACAQVMQDARTMHYVDFEMNWIGDFNPKMMRVAELMGGIVNKQHITFRKMLDPALPFERMPMIR